MNTQTSIDKTRDKVGRVGTEMQGELESLSAQVERLAGEIARMGRSGMRSARAGASEGLETLSRSGADLGKGLGRELAHVETRTSAAVRNRPLQTLGVAVAVGFLIGAVLRR